MASISAYQKFISPKLLEALLAQATPIPEIPGLHQVGERSGLESIPGLSFLASLYTKLSEPLDRILRQREKDRDFIDQRTLACQALNRTLRLDLSDPEYHTVLGHEDGDGRIVIGPLNEGYAQGGKHKAVAEIPSFLQGTHVTLFGPPDDPKLSINAMNAFHRKLKNEPPIVGELLNPLSQSPFWGADDEDSKTPLRRDLISAGTNLAGCFEKTLTYTDPKSGKVYTLEQDHLALPIKRFPGLALPSLFLFYEGDPLPLHLYDFALHLYHHRKTPEALSFYVPKLENEEEARYIHLMIQTAEALLQQEFPDYRLGTVRLFTVLENPRAIFRIHEIIDALFPYFAGASLGWHDFLSSTARLFKNDPNYRIPVKSDPDIVIKYIKTSHEVLANTVGAHGGIKIGGMYGVLPYTADPATPSFQMTLRGFIKDVITQMKRNLTGYWVAHPDFVRIGLALVEAWKQHQAGRPGNLETLVRGLITDPEIQNKLVSFINGPDVQSLDPKSPLYPRSLIVADIKESSFIANNHPDEVRYNVFQSLQYLTDWLSGNGCVALPSEIEGVPVRVMDDLATAERSRWEVWHELHHKRFPFEQFISIVHEEMRFIRKDTSHPTKKVEVKWDERTQKWYPIAEKIMLQLMTHSSPVEFASELLLPFTIEIVRASVDPWNEVNKLAPEKFTLEPYVRHLHDMFTACGCLRFAREMSQGLFIDLKKAEGIIKTFNLEEIKEAASFHGDIGESKRTLDPMAQREQSAIESNPAILTDLKTLAEEYLKKFGIKFLVSAHGKTASELLAILKVRMANTAAIELENARIALWEITRKRLSAHPLAQLPTTIDSLRQKHHVLGAAIAITSGDFDPRAIQNFVSGAATATEAVTPTTRFEIASLSKSVASCFAVEYFRKRSIPLDSSVNELFKKTKSLFRIKSLDKQHPEWADEVTLSHLLEHSALNMHYVLGFPADKTMPKVSELLQTPSQWNYAEVGVLHKPGTQFKYSGGGFLVLEHLLESLEGKPVTELAEPFLKELGLNTFTFQTARSPVPENIAHGYLSAGKEVEGGRLTFPAFAAGALSNAEDVVRFLTRLTQAFHSANGASPISHDTAITMLHGSDKGSHTFMAAKMGLGIFVAEAGPNRLVLHQGANDGFRALFLHCVDGPDCGKGFTILCNADENGVLFVAELAQALLKQLDFQGVDFSLYSRDAVSPSPENFSKEEGVNQGYKNLVFHAFREDLPVEIVKKGQLDPLSPFNLAVDATILSVTNQKFALAKNLLSPHVPIFDPELYDRQGKVMDSWESVRHNNNPYEELFLELKTPGKIEFVFLSTKYHFGNQAEHVQIDGKELGAESWEPIVPKIKLEGHSEIRIALKNGIKCSRIRVRMFPDGGLTRLGLFDDRLPKSERSLFLPVETAKSIPCADPIPKSHKPLAPPYIGTRESIDSHWTRLKPGTEVDIASAAFGGQILSATNEHYSPASQVISPFPPIHMFDGFESARSRGKDHFEEALIAFGKESIIHRVEVDFTYFRNNNPRELQLSVKTPSGWKVILNKRNVKAYAGNCLNVPVTNNEKCSQLRVTVFPDGGINRIRVFSKVP